MEKGWENGYVVLAGKITEGSHLQRFLLLTALARSRSLLSCHARGRNAKRFTILISAQLGTGERRKRKKNSHRVDIQFRIMSFSSQESCGDEDVPVVVVVISKLKQCFKC